VTSTLDLSHGTLSRSTHHQPLPRNQILLKTRKKPLYTNERTLRPTPSSQQHQSKFSFLKVARGQNFT